MRVKGRWQSVRLPPDLFQALQEYAEDRGMTRPEVIRQALAVFLAAHGYYCRRRRPKA